MNDRATDRQTLLSKKLFIFDMDGTVYLGGRVFDFAVRFIRHLRENGQRILFFTNNASHSGEFYLEKLNRLGFVVTKEEILTSGDVTAAYLTEKKKGKKVYLVGTPELDGVFRRAGVPLVADENGRLAVPGLTADIVVTSFDTTLTYEKLSEACRMVRCGAEYLSTHPDFNCPTEDGFIPDSGAIAALVTASTGKVPVYFGKPYKETAEMIAQITGYRSEEMCIFGDRLYTDIALGRHFGMTSCLVLSGETTLSDVADASEAERPDMIFSSLAETDALLFGEASV